MKTKQHYFKAGVKSGLFTGLFGAIFFSFIMTFYGVWLLENHGEIFAIVFFLLYTIPIGLLLGSIIGIVVGIIAYKSSFFQRILKPVVIIFCAIACSYYPLRLLVLPLFLEVSFDPLEVSKAPILLVGTFLGGGVVGLLGSRRFWSYINSGDEELLEVTVQPE